MFFRLGVLNVRRQLMRSLLVILTLALAAIRLTVGAGFDAARILAVDGNGANGGVAS